MYEYRCKAIRVVDGDTIDCEVDLGFRVHIAMRFRLLGINAPERGSVEATAATKRLQQLTMGEKLIVRTRKDKTEKYGRYLGTFYTEGVESINETMVQEGHAVRYME